jgi:hypothetical protein
MALRRERAARRREAIQHRKTEQALVVAKEAAEVANKAKRRASAMKSVHR